MVLIEEREKNSLKITAFNIIVRRRRKKIQSMHAHVMNAYIEKFPIPKYQREYGRSF